MLINEFLHLGFKNIKFNETVNYNAPVYYFTLAFKNLIISIILFRFINKSNILKDKRASKSLIVGVIGWDLVELYQEYCYIAKIDDKVLYFNDGLWGQLSLIFGVMLLTYLLGARSK